MKNITLYIIRHGETYLNKYKKMQGWSDAPLSEKGIQEAISTGKRLANINFDAIYASDLGRTKATAELIRNENLHQNLDIIPMKELRETFFGSLDGSFAQDVYQQIATKLGLRPEDLFKQLSLAELSDEIKALDSFHEAEDMVQVKTRLKIGLDHILASTKEESATIMVVTHGNIIRILVSMLDPTIQVQRELKNSGITTVSFHDQGATILGFDE